jgi:hypothetical protein
MPVSAALLPAYNAAKATSTVHQHLLLCWGGGLHHDAAHHPQQHMRTTCMSKLATTAVAHPLWLKLCLLSKSKSASTLPRWQTTT